MGGVFDVVLFFVSFEYSPTSEIVNVQKARDVSDQDSEREVRGFSISTGLARRPAVVGDGSWNHCRHAA